MTILSYMSDLANFGAAGLMGAMWLWERRLGHARDQQISEAHQRILRDEERLSKLTEVVEQNTSAIVRFTETQRQVGEALKDLTREFHHERPH